MSRDLLFQALRGEKTERTPWVPFVGCHGGALIGVDAETYLKSGTLMAQGALEAIKLYQPDGIPVAFDLQIEAEALGCRLQWAKENPPAVISHVLDEVPLAQLKIPDEHAGRFPEVLKAARLLKKEIDDIVLFGLVTGPFTLSLHLKGMNLFTDMFDHPLTVKELMAFCTQVAKRTAHLYIDAGCDIIALVDPMTSQISPHAFREFVAPYVSDVFNDLRQRQIYSSFFVCGHAQKNIEAMCETGPDNISVDENIPLDFVRDTCTKYHISFGGNLQLTIVLLMGDEDAVRRNTIECLNAGGDRGFILAPGCDLPYAVPPHNLQLVAKMIHDPYQRQIAQELIQKEHEVSGGINLSDYGQSDKIIIDIITLDSEACAPCQYMVEAVKRIVPQFNDLVLWREHKIKEKESVEFMMGLMVKNIPTICIDGKIKFVSKIPARDELIRAIQERINEKYFLIAKRHHGKLLVLGAGCERGEQTWTNVQQAAKELGSSVTLQRIDEEQEIYQYGVSATPAIVSIREVVKSSGRIPTVEVIKEWLKDLE